MNEVRFTDRMTLACEISFDARYGQEASRGLCLGGGGIFFVAWQVGYLTALMDAGVAVRSADRVVGTSAGSLVATVLVRDGLRRLQVELDVLGHFPRLAKQESSSKHMHPSQERAWDIFERTTSSDHESIRTVGHAALAAQTAAPEDLRRTITRVAGNGDWPGEAVHITCMDTFTGERCVVQQESGASPTEAMAASTALPGMFPPQQVLDRKCMDGGVGATALHLDLLAGAKTALVLSLRGFTASGATQQDATDLIALKESGTRVITAVPESFSDDQMMDPSAIPTAWDMGSRQGAADAPAVLELWSTI